MGKTVKSIGGAIGGAVGGVTSALGGAKAKRTDIDTKPFQVGKEAQRARKEVQKEQQQLKQREAQTKQGRETLVGQLQAQAAGTGPSLAEAQLKSASNRNLAQQLAAEAKLILK